MSAGCLWLFREMSGGREPDTGLQQDPGKRGLDRHGTIAPSVCCRAEQPDSGQRRKWGQRGRQGLAGSMLGSGPRRQGVAAKGLRLGGKVRSWSDPLTWGHVCLESAMGLGLP